MVTLRGLEPRFPPWKGGVLDQLDDRAIYRSKIRFLGCHTFLPISARRHLFITQVDPSCEVRLRSQSPLFSCRASPFFFDNSFFFYGSLLEPLHSFIAKIPVQPQVLLYLCRPVSSGKERSSELTNITEPIISKHFCQREVGLPKVQDSGRGPSFVFCPISRTTDVILELPF